MGESSQSTKIPHGGAKSVSNPVSIRDRAEPKLRKAVDDDNVEELRSILEQVKTGTYLDHGHIYNYEYLCRVNLLRSCDLGKLQSAQFLLELGTETRAQPTKQSPLLQAIQRGHLAVTELLLKYGAPVDEQDRNGLTALMHIAKSGKKHASQAFELLINAGARVDIFDKEGRTVLHYVAADKKRAAGIELVDMILRSTVDIEAPDKELRTPLHWASITGHTELAHRLLLRVQSKHTSTSRREILGKTPLYLAVTHDQEQIVALLLEHGADANLPSLGGWTPLHIACQRAKYWRNDSQIVDKLIEAGADVNSQTTTGDSPLHYAAEAGISSIIQSLLQCPRIKVNIRDEYGSTPFSKAIKAKSISAIQLLAPLNFEWLPQEIRRASITMRATVVDFGKYPDGKRRSEFPIFDLLYTKNNERAEKTYSMPGMRVSPEIGDATRFRWIHLPANNISWAEALLSKVLIEEGEYDIDKFMMMEKSIEDLQRGQRFVTHYTRQICLSTPEGRTIYSYNDPLSRAETLIDGNDSQIAGQQTTALRRVETDDVMSLFAAMPYIHFEPSSSGDGIDDKLSRAFSLQPASTQIMTNTAQVYGAIPYRNTHGITFDKHMGTYHTPIVHKSDQSDSQHNQNISLYMVGQLWIWILSERMIVTSMPQQWAWPEDVHLNVFEKIINDTKHKSKNASPVESIVELACMITSRCVSMLEAHAIKGNDFLFLDTFEQSISIIGDRVYGLFGQFNADSQQASKWLKRRRGATMNIEDEADAGGQFPDDISAEPECVDRLLDIHLETDLLNNIQGLQDELVQLTTVLRSQEALIMEFLKKFVLQARGQREIERACRKQLSSIRGYVSDVERMMLITNSAHTSVTNLLDLKHRYANVFEARFARYQATDTMHQGQTIMVFTVVTVIFLPLSFLGTLFSVNISDFPQGEGGEPSMPLAYVSKWVIGIGFAISVPLVALALSYEKMMKYLVERRKSLAGKWREARQHRPRKKASSLNSITDLSEVAGNDYQYSQNFGRRKAKFGRQKSPSSRAEV